MLILLYSIAHEVTKVFINDATEVRHISMQSEKGSKTESEMPDSLI